jgi:MoxR-like ATPase
MNPAVRRGLQALGVIAATVALLALLIDAVTPGPSGSIGSSWRRWRARREPSRAFHSAPARAPRFICSRRRGRARLNGRDFVTPDDVAAMAVPVLRHRLVLSPEAELERFSRGQAIASALSAVAVPR